MSGSIRQCLLAVLSLTLLSASPVNAATQTADTVYKNGFVYTVDGALSRAEAFAVKDGKFVAVGSDDEMKAVTGKDTKVVNLKGKMAMPGLVDGHIHALRGALTAQGVIFNPTDSIDTIKAAVKKYMVDNKVKKGDWVEGAKWSHDYKKLTAKMLDDIAPDNPVFLHDWTNHLGWVNTAALKAAKITKDTPDPQGGVIDRDKDGNPTGTLHDKALGLITTAMPPPDAELMEARATWILNKLNEYGITSIQTATASTDTINVINAYRGLDAKNKLTARVHVAWDFNTRYTTASLEGEAAKFMTRKARGENTPLVNVDTVKVYMDGVPNDALEGGAPMIDSYATAPTFGTPSIDEATYTTYMRRFDSAGLTTMSHATGSMSVRHFLNALEATRRANGKGPRHHLAHSMLVYPEDLPRMDFTRSNFVAEVSPFNTWVPDPSGTDHWKTIIGPELFDRTMTPINSMVKAGAVVVYGSDWDNIPGGPDPWLGVEGMVTRMYPGHPEYGRFNPDERIDIETAIKIFTINGAIALSAEDETGSIEVGKSADFIVINQNLLEVAPEKIHETKVHLTVLQGKTVYEK